MRQLVRFMCVGGGATITHYLGVLILTYHWRLNPEAANVLAFIIAFAVSFIGHWRWTFREQQARFQRALPAFAFIAISMFLLNACIFHLLLEFMRIRFEISLLFAQSVVVLITYVASKYWAFARPLSALNFK